MANNIMEKLIALCKRRGFIYPGSEIYGGVANTYDYGPMGVELLRNLQNLWWVNFVEKREDMVGLDASIISHHKIWEASGHVATFADAMIDCRNCRHRMRADHLLEDSLNKNVEGMPLVELESLLNENKVVCPVCGEFDWTPIRKFNQLFGVELGLVQGDDAKAYLRGETAQGMFVNFKNIIDSTRIRLPFGVAQLGKSFRNEITPGNSVFRTLEFVQGEIEYFFDPESTKWEKLFADWQEEMWEFVVNKLKISENDLRWREHTEKERSFYSKKTVDLEYNFPFGFKELWGLAYRTDYDLHQQQEYSRKDLSYIDPQTGKKFLPHVIEPALGITRSILMILSNAYTEDDKRVFLKIAPSLAPVKVAVFPLLHNKPELIETAREVYNDLQNNINGKIIWDDRGNIGKRYLAQDEIGTPWCITVDFQSLEDGMVTVRNRDTTQQDRIKIEDLTSHFNRLLITI